MEKFKIWIIAICLIFLVDGCYAFYQGNDLTNNAATDISSSPVSPNTPSDEANNQSNNVQNDNTNIAKDIAQNNKIDNFVFALEETYINAGVIYDTWEFVPNSADSIVLNDISANNIEQ